MSQQRAAIGRVLKILRGFGCEKAGFMDNWTIMRCCCTSSTVVGQFSYAPSAKGWATLWLKKNPLSYRARKTEFEHKQEALRQGHLAVNSILRDWIKGQVTAVECGILSFEAVFMPFMLTHDGRPMLEHVSDLLPKPDEPKVVKFKGPTGAA
jgi:hypothetical protein